MRAAGGSSELVIWNNPALTINTETGVHLLQVKPVTCPMLAHWDQSPGDAVPEARADPDHLDPRPGPTAPTATLELSSQLVLKATEDFQVFPVSEGLFCPPS